MWRRGAGRVKLRWPSGGMDQRGRCGLTDMGEDVGDGLRVGRERDEREIL